MRKQLAFAFAAAAIGLITIAWAKDSIVVPNHDVARPKTELAPRYYARSTDRIIQYETEGRLRGRTPQRPSSMPRPT